MEAGIRDAQLIYSEFCYHQKTQVKTISLICILPREHDY